MANTLLAAVIAYQVLVVPVTGKKMATKSRHEAPRAR